MADVKDLPYLRTRDEVQLYLTTLSKELEIPSTDPQFAAELDSRDQLKRFRGKFSIPLVGDLLEGRDIANDIERTSECVYLCGNSLGLEPKVTKDIMNKELDKWSKKGAYGRWDGVYPWYPIEEFVKEESARLVGAKPIEVVVMNSLTVNVHLALVSFYRPTPQRYKILILKNEFSSDKYVVESQVRCHGYTPSDAIVCIEPQEGQLIWQKEDVLQAIEDHGDSTALIWLSGVHYSTGHLFDIKSITEAGHRKGCNVGFDLAHATGNVQLKLHEWEVDVAAWCTYKYLNSGPGALAGYFIHEKYAYSFDMPRFSGWWSTNRDSRLDMDDLELKLQPGADGFQLSNPPLFSMMGVIGGLQVFKETSMDDLCLKSRILTGYLEMLLEENLNRNKMGDKGHVNIITSKDLNERGCQLSLQFSSSSPEDVKKYISMRGGVVDFRPPDLMRVAPIPLYNSFTDVLKFYNLFKTALETIK